MDLCVSGIYQGWVVVHWVGGRHIPGGGRDWIDGIYTRGGDNWVDSIHTMGWGTINWVDGIYTRVWGTTECMHAFIPGFG